MVYNCCVPLCNTCCPNKNNIAVFRPPRNPSLFLKWKESIPEIEVLTLDDRVCELHFKEEDIIRYFEVDVQGVVNKIPLCRSRLKDGAVPTIWPGKGYKFFVIELHVMIIAILILDHPNLKSYPEVVVEEPQIERQIKDGFVYEKRRKSISIVNIPINCSQYIYIYILTYYN